MENSYSFNLQVYLNNPVAMDWIRAIEANNPTDKSHGGWINIFL